ncbi:MAG: hypothetical protein OHM77_02055 [Candidatus Nitricoxidivorans perseverans]|uniref:Uncharacterized protein n=1 Tax=Candidatus Nitricoxidivorans perseverans TaxID=2975601 RepID=A0AA49FLJ4_9PROT|nr:MAG: hypothetical protein OHM77_02055 [Candidatus Nitricoxidivorans perseverans]
MSASSRGFAIAAALACAAPLQSVGAELQPYSLPSQQIAPRMEQRQMEQHPMEQRAVRPRISEVYYQNFGKKVEGLNPAQRAELIKSFGVRRDQAIEGGRVDEAQHYLRLLQILGK